MTRSTPAWARRVIGRPEIRFSFPASLGRVLVTGAAGSVGQALEPHLRRAAEEYAGTDVAAQQGSGMSYMDVTSPGQVDSMVEAFQPGLIIHLAGAKHAPYGEEDPGEYMRVNAGGTENVLSAALRTGSKIVVSSTCKACAPETAYGAAKLIAERMALNAGATVARYYNIADSRHNVFETWAGLPRGAPLPITPCHRIFITMREALTLTLWAAAQPSGRYALASVVSQPMAAVASRYAKRDVVDVPRRRGDRLTEPYMATHEHVEATDDPRFVRIVSPHDGP